MTGGVVNPLAFVAAIQSAGDKHKVKILQQSTIMTTHNKQARSQVTEQEPVITGTTGGAPGLDDDHATPSPPRPRHLQGHRHHAQGDAR